MSSVPSTPNKHAGRASRGKTAAKAEKAMKDKGGQAGNSTRAPEKMPTKSRTNEVKNRGLAPNQRARAAHLRASGNNAKTRSPSPTTPQDDWLDDVFADDDPSTDNDDDEQDSLFTDDVNGLTEASVTSGDSGGDSAEDEDGGDDFPPLPDDGLGPLGSTESTPRLKRSITDLIGDLTPDQYAEARTREPEENKRWSGGVSGVERVAPEWTSIDTLVSADYNPRAIDPDEFAALKTSIDEFGMPDPIIANRFPGRENVVVGGHQRLKAARDLGWREVPVTWVYLNPVRERQLNIALNRISGRWEERMLAEVMRDLDDVGADLTMTGFSDEEVSELLATTESIDDALDFGHEFDSEHQRTYVEVIVRCPPDEWDDAIGDAAHELVQRFQVDHPHLSVQIKGGD